MASAKVAWSSQSGSKSPRNNPVRKQARALMRAGNDAMHKKHAMIHELRSRGKNGQTSRDNKRFLGQEDMALLLGIRGKRRARGKIRRPPGAINIAKTESLQPWISSPRARSGTKANMYLYEIHRGPDKLVTAAM